MEWGEKNGVGSYLKKNLILCLIQFLAKEYDFRLLQRLQSRCSELWWE